jgi:hypothetical protein
MFVIFEGTDIPYNTVTKFLSIHINENIKWKNHIKYFKVQSLIQAIIWSAP